MPSHADIYKEQKIYDPLNRLFPGAESGQKNEMAGSGFVLTVRSVCAVKKPLTYS